MSWIVAPGKQRTPMFCLLDLLNLCWSNTFTIESPIMTLLCFFVGFFPVFVRFSILSLPFIFISSCFHALDSLDSLTDFTITLLSKAESLASSGSGSFSSNSTWMGFSAILSSKTEKKFRLIFVVVAEVDWTFFEDRFGLTNSFPGLMFCPPDFSSIIKENSNIIESLCWVMSVNCLLRIV